MSSIASCASASFVRAQATLATGALAPPVTAGVQRDRVCGRVITVCHPVWRLERGGLERQLVQVVRGLPSHTFRHVLGVRGCRPGEPDEGEEFAPNVRVVRQYEARRDRFWAMDLASILRRYAVDVLHVRGLSMLLDSLLAARLCGDVRVAFSFHGFEKSARRLGSLRRRLYRAAVTRCDDRWAVSATAADAIAQELRLPAEIFNVVTNGVDTQRWAPSKDRAAVRRRLGLPADRTVILSVGNLKPVKGHHVLLEAVGSLGYYAGRTTFVVVGGDYMDGRLQQWTDERLGGCDVRFVGQQGDVLPWYQAADVFVLPSKWEGLSNALLEAMACGLPVIATDVGGNRDVIRHGQTGLLVRPDDPMSLCAAIRLMVEDPVYRATLAAAGRRHVHERFSLSETIRACAAHYRDLVRGRRLPRSAPGGVEVLPRSPVP